MKPSGGGPFLGRHHRVRMSPMEEISGGNVLKTCGTAITLLPAYLLCQVDQFVFKDSLQSFQPGMAFNAANRDWSIAITKIVKNKSGGDRNLIPRPTVAQKEALRCAARRSHSPRQAKSNRTTIQRPAAMVSEKALVISLEQELQIGGMNRGEVRSTDVLRST